MAKVSDDTAYCVKHGWVEVVDRAELVPGVFVPCCSLCGAIGPGGLKNG